METEERKPDFFISYSGYDQAWAEWIASVLESDGFSTIYQARDFAAASNFVIRMQKALEECGRMIAVLSPAYLKSGYCKSEWAAAYAQDPTGEKGILIPVRIHECDLRALYSTIVYIDLVGLDETDAAKTLLDGVRGKAAPSGAKKSFPGKAKADFPGSGPAIWNIPHLRNPNFTGREELLTALRESLAEGRTTALTQAIHGLGGVGKTQLAVEYAYRFKAHYDIVWWVASEEKGVLASDYASLAQRLDLPEKDEADQRVICGAVREWLRCNSGWLLIFDNVEKPEDIHDYIPQGAPGHIIVTSRHSAWKGTAHPLSVHVWPREESIAFLARRIGEDDKESADKLSGLLGDLPLALEQAAAYIEQAGSTIAAYVHLFQSNAKDLLARGAPSSEYPASVATTWDISFKAVEEACPEAGELLNLCAFFAPDDIPLDIIRDGAEELPDSLAAVVTDEIKLNDCLSALRSYSLVEADSGNISIHRLVQAVIRDRLTEEETKSWAESAVSVVSKAFPFDSDDVRTWPECARLLPHGLSTAAHSERHDAAPEATGRVLNQLGLYLWGRAQFAEARELLERALAIDEKALGPDHPNVGRDLSNLGQILQDMGDLPGAKEHTERALTIAERTLGSDHPNVGAVLSNLGRILHAMGDLPGAKKHTERALAIDEKALGPEHPTVAIDLNNLGQILKAMGDLPGAKKYTERALTIGEKAYGRDHPQVGIYSSNLGMILKAMGDLPGAKKLTERALAIDEKAYEPDHPQLAIYSSNLGQILQAMGDLPGAKEYTERAVAIHEKALGPDHPRVAIDLNNLGQILQDMGDLPGAKKHTERALAIDEKALGPDHPNVAIRLGNLAIVERDMGNLAQAMSLLKRADRIFRQYFDDSHPYMQEMSRRVASVGFQIALKKKGKGK